MMLAAINPTIAIAVPVALGVVAVYFLLPKPRVAPLVVGVAFGIAALVTGGMFLVREAAGAHWVEAILFYSFSALTLIGGVLLVTNRNPARGAVSFTLVILSVCGLFLLLGAPFLMAGTIIIYAGAIIVTFLFVIMLSHQHGPSNADARTREPLLSCIAGGLLLAVLLGVIGGNYDSTGIDAVIAAAENVGPNAELSSVREAIRSVPSPGLKNRLEILEDEATVRINRAETPDAKSEELIKFRKALAFAKNHVGDAVPPDYLTLSAWSGQPANKSVEGRLPAGNVAAIGRSLYSDYVLGVELAGTLLLVATIGAIAITRRSATRAPA